MQSLVIDGFRSVRTVCDFIEQLDASFYREAFIPTLQ
jgi:hypothetical protein